MLWSPNTRLLYPFENTALDYSGNARHGTVFGSGVYATKPNGGRCLYFDGVGDYVATPSFGLSGSVVVFAADVRCKFSSTVGGIFLSDNGADPGVGLLRYFRVVNTNTLRWRYSNGAVVTGEDATDFFAAPYEDVWLNAVIVCDYAGKKCYFYRKGVLFSVSGTMTGTPLFPSTTNQKYVGWYTTNQFLTTGYLANVQLWTLATMPAAGQMLANVNRLMLGMNPIW